MNSSSSSAIVNKKSYSSPKVAKYWSSYSDHLLYGEQRIITELKPFISGSRFLDLGVGGGRTTRHLQPLVSSYLGIDYSDLLIKACRENYPDVCFELLDVCQVHSLGVDKYDFVFFSFNGIDCLSAAQREQFLQGLIGVLAPGGHFLFSSHNFYQARADLSRRSILNEAISSLIRERAFTPRHVYHLISSFLSYCSGAALQKIGDDCSFLLDQAQGYRELYAWIKPDRQVRDLEKAGYEVVELYSWHGEPLALADPRLRDSCSIYYLCKKKDSLLVIQ